MIENVEKFINALRMGLKGGTFVKLSLANYKGAEPNLQKILIRPVTTKKGSRLYFLYRGGTREIAKNYDFETGIGLIRRALDGDFASGHLFTTDHDLQLKITRKGKAHLNRAKPTYHTPPDAAHDREKLTQIDPKAFYLKALGITDDSGRIHDKQQDKWRQINKFIEVLANLVDRSPIGGKSRISVVDMGCGKGYLTFAAYDYFRNIRDVDVQMTGVDTRSDLIKMCSDIANACDLDGLKFTEGTIDGHDIGDVDVLIALHACDTATDDALFKGIAGNAALIVAAPCCHHEIRPQLRPPEHFRDILKHAVMLERFAEIVTDGIRSLLLERSGYSTRLFEFIGSEHTPKNNLLVATKRTQHTDADRFDSQIDAIKLLFSIEHQRLERLLKDRDAALSEFPVHYPSSAE